MESRTSLPSSVVLKLTEEVLKVMFIQKLKKNVAMLAFAFLTLAVSSAAFRQAAGQPVPVEPKPSVVKPESDDWQGIWKATSFRRGNEEDSKGGPMYFCVHAPSPPPPPFPPPFPAPRGLRSHADSIGLRGE